MPKNPALEAYRRSKHTVQAASQRNTEDPNACKSCGYGGLQDVVLADGREATYCMNCRVTMPVSKKAD